VQDETEVPIPLTRLQTPRPKFRSAMDLPAYAPGTTADEAGTRDSSASTTLPPLVASLPPVAAPLYVPRASGGLAYGKMMAFWGSVALVAAVAIVTGVAVGRRVASADGATPAHAAAGSLAPLAQPRAAPPAHAVSLPAATVQTAAEPAVPARSETPALVVALTPVEELPKASAPSPAPEPPAKPVVVRPAAPGVAASGSASPAPVAPVATHAAAPQAAPKADEHTDHAPAANAVASPEKDTASAEEVSAKAAPAASADAPTPTATAPAEPPVDPLLKAMREEVQDEQAHTPRK
jgi:hypothetical protein